MNLSRWFDLQEIIGKKSRQKNDKLLDVAIAELRESRDSGTAKFIMTCIDMGDSNFPLSGSFSRLAYAQEVATYATDDPQWNALKHIVRTFEEDDSELSPVSLVQRFAFLESAFDIVNRDSEFHLDLELYPRYLNAYLKEVKKIASFNKLHVIKSLAIRQFQLPSDIKPEVREAIANAIIEISDKAVSGAAAIRKLIPGKQAGTEARAEA